MGFIKKMRRAKARPEAKKAAVAERNMVRQAVADVYQDKADYRDAEAAIQARCKISTAYTLNVMRKVFKLTRNQILEINKGMATLAWCLKYSYDKFGNVLKVPMVTHTEIKAQLKEECNFDFQPCSLDGCSKKIAYCRDRLDNALLALLLLVRDVAGFGKVRLARMMDKVHELMYHASYEEYVAMATEGMEKLGIMSSKSFSEKIVPREMFSAWIYE